MNKSLDAGLIFLRGILFEFPTKLETILISVLNLAVRILWLVVRTQVCSIEMKANKQNIRDVF